MTDFVKSASIVKVIDAQSVKAAIEIEETNLEELITYINIAAFNKQEGFESTGIDDNATETALTIGADEVATFGQMPVTPSALPTTDYQVANKKYVDDTAVINTGNETIAGVKTFSSSPVVPTPTTDMQAGTKKYTDDREAILQAQLDLFSIRAGFSFKDTDEIYLNGGVYNHIGTTTQRLYWDSQLTFAFGSGGSNALSEDLGVSEWHYVYLDDSAIVTADTNVIAATELVNNTTAPTWSDSKKGWYNGNDRCIFAVLTNGSSEMLEFIHAGDLIMLADAIGVDTGAGISTSYADISAFSMPSFANKVLAYARLDYGNNQASISWRTKGQTGTVGHEILKVAGASVRNSSQFIAITDSNHVIQLIESTGTSNTVDINQDGWFLPEGM